MGLGTTADLLSAKQSFLCQYDRKTGKDTVRSVIYDLSGKKVFRADGNPPSADFKRMSASLS